MFRLTAIALSVAALVATSYLSAHAQTGSRMTNPSGLQIIDNTVGTGASPAGKTAVVHYTGWIYENGAKGKKFDSSVDRGQPFEFPVGAGRVIRGWDEGVLGMKPGGKRLLVIPPDKAYGAKGAGEGAIPPNATLVFEVEIARITQQLDPAPKAP